MKLTEYQYNHTISSFDINASKRVSVIGLTKMMHEAAMRHVLLLGLSYWDLPKHLTWVLLRKSQSFFLRPTLGEPLSIYTYPSGIQRVFTFRDFIIKDSQNRIVANASTTWAMMDTNTRRLAPIIEQVKNLSMKDEKEALPRSLGKFPAFANSEHQKTFQVQWHELDWNGHLNNIYYLQWMLEALPRTHLEHQNLNHLEINYKAECFFEEKLTAQVQSLTAGTYLHRLLNTTGKEVATAKTSWT